MIKRLNLLKFAILTCIACNAFIAANSQASAKEHKYVQAEKEPDRVKKTGARKFPSSVKTFSVNKSGAKGDGQTPNVSAIQKAIDACAKTGGVIVVFGPGSYVTVSLFAAGLKGSLLQDFHFNNVQVQGNTAGSVSYAGGRVFNNVVFTGADGAPLQVNNSEKKMKPDQAAEPGNNKL